MKLSPIDLSRVEKLNQIDNDIANEMKNQHTLLKRQLNEFQTTYANLKSVEGQATATTTNVLNDMHLRNQLQILDFIQMGSFSNFWSCSCHISNKKSIKI